MQKKKAASPFEKGYLLVTGATLIWGTYGLFVRYLDFPPALILFFRFFTGMLGLLVFLVVRKNLSFVEPARLYWKLMLWPAFLSGLSWLAYTYSLSYTTVANAVFLIYTAPVFVVIFAPLILGEKIQAKTVVALAFSLLGISLIMGYGSLFSAKATLTGDLIALCGGMTYGLFVLFIKRMPSQLLGLPSNLLLSLYISLALFPFALYSFHLLNPKSLLLLAGLGILQQTAGSSMYHSGLRMIKAQHAGILGYIEPLIATALAAYFLGEQLTGWTVLGGALIVFAGAIVIFRRT